MGIFYAETLSYLIAVRRHSAVWSRRDAFILKMRERQRLIIGLRQAADPDGNGPPENIQEYSVDGQTILPKVEKGLDARIYSHSVIRATQNAMRCAASQL